MAVAFRCEKCGKLLKAEGPAGGATRCGHCGKRVVIPAGLASLPRPEVPPNHGPAPAPPVERSAPVDAEPDPAALGVLAGAMPWVISACLHLGLFLIMVFIVMVTTKPEPEANVVQFFEAVPRRRTLGGLRGPKTRRPTRGQSERRTVVRQTDREEVRRPARTETPVTLLAPGSRGSLESGRAKLGLDYRTLRGGQGLYDLAPGPSPLGVRNIVYVLDRSGSMAPKFDEVKRELGRAISTLAPVHRFHVVLFSNGKTIEGPRRCLVPGELKNKTAAWRFVRDQTAEGVTTALVALKRAFAVLGGADDRTGGSVIYLLSDGDFAGITGGSAYRTPAGKVLNGNEAVLQWLRDRNAAKRVMINTILLHGSDPTAKRVLRTIAEENAGRFKYISPDE